ncbi:hydantoinase B/oxoprolinase family protein, partial [Methylibium sp. T29-B]|uniref:hydantoinase B/oxoprolinase family protein n=1 Tax=Methylibium sp. T29-B TaxID=1437443 RepID=UPI0018CC4340
GGEAGALGINRVERAPGTAGRRGAIEELGPLGSVAMEPGDVFVIETPGGGGYGSPGL